MGTVSSMLCILAQFPHSSFPPFSIKRFFFLFVFCAPFTWLQPPFSWTFGRYTACRLNLTLDPRIVYKARTDADVGNTCCYYKPYLMSVCDMCDWGVWYFGSVCGFFLTSTRERACRHFYYYFFFEWQGIWDATTNYNFHVVDCNYKPILSLRLRGSGMAICCFLDLRRTYNYPAVVPKTGKDF